MKSKEGNGRKAEKKPLLPLLHNHPSPRSLVPRFATFKPRRRPASPAAAAPPRPAAPRKAVLQPVLGEEPLEPAETDPTEPEFTSAGKPRVTG